MEVNLLQILGAKKITPLGQKGFFTNPVLVKGGRHDGEVCKPLRGIVTEEVARLHIKAYRWYCETLKEQAIKIPRTTMKSFEVLPSGFMLFIFQEYFRSEEWVVKLLQTEKEEKCLRLFELMLLATLNVIFYNNRQNYPQNQEAKEIGLNSIPRSWAFRDEGLFLLDTFPPYQKRSGRIWPENIVEHYPIKLKTLLSWVFPLITKENFHPPTMFAALVQSTIRIRPELTTSFIERAKSWIKINFEGSEREEILKRFSLRRLNWERKITKFFGIFLR